MPYSGSASPVDPVSTNDFAHPVRIHDSGAPRRTLMTETRVARVTGIGALACVALSWLQFPLWVIGEPPSMYDGAGFARHLFDIRTMALHLCRHDGVRGGLSPPGPARPT